MPNDGEQRDNFTTRLNGYWNTVFSLLSDCGLICYVACPPVPSHITSKIAFHPPPKNLSYRLALKSDPFKVIKNISQVKNDECFIIVRDLKNIDVYLPSDIYEVFHVTTAYKNDLVGMRCMPSETDANEQQVILYCQPNSTDLGYFLQPSLISLFCYADVFEMDVYGFDYSGYGYSSGSPGEKNVYADVRAMYQYIRDTKPEKKIVLMGYSIGTTAVIDLAAENPEGLAGVVLVAPFCSGLRLMQSKPAEEQTCWADAFRSYDKVSNIQAKVLICHGDKDEVVPLSHGMALFERLKNPVPPAIIHGGDHNELMTEDFPQTFERIIRIKYAMIENVTIFRPSKKGWNQFIKFILPKFEMPRGVEQINDPSTRQLGCCGMFFSLLRGCGLMCYIACPPVPSQITRKLAFHPPAKDTTYRIALKSDPFKKIKNISQVKNDEYFIIINDLSTKTDTYPPSDYIEVFHVTTVYNNDLVGVRCMPSETYGHSALEEQVVLFCQPNSSDLGGFLQPSLTNLMTYANYFEMDVYGFDYSGFGYSSGSPGEKNVYADVRAMYQYIRDTKPEKKIVLMGYSIGTTAAIDLAAENPEGLSGVVLVAPFCSGLRLMQSKPAEEQTCWADVFRSYDKVSNIQAKVLICHGDMDEVVPLSHGMALFERLKNPVPPAIIHGGNHQEMLSGKYPQTFDRIVRFLKFETTIGTRSSEVT